LYHFPITKAGTKSFFTSFLPALIIQIGNDTKLIFMLIQANVIQAIHYQRTFIFIIERQNYKCQAFLTDKQHKNGFCVYSSIINDINLP